MGYSNKRKRSKRRKTKILTAFQSNNNFHDQNGSTSDDSSSNDTAYNNGIHRWSFGSQLQNATTPTGGKEVTTVPNNIFIDDVTSMNMQDHIGSDWNRATLLNNSEMEHQVSALDLDNPDDYQNLDILSLGDTSNIEDDLLSLQSSSSSESSVSMRHQPNHVNSHNHHSFEHLTREEIASFKIMSLLDAAGAPRICYDRLVALLKKLSRKDNFDVKKAINRETLMNRLGRKYKNRPRIQSTTINKQEVFRFMFHDMLQDLLHSCSQHLHIIAPPNTGQSDTSEEGSLHELWNTPWMRKTFEMEQHQNFDIQKDIMLPVILYMDKTGTDVNQRYSLEPVLFSLGAIPREQRESRHSWRHLGFIPPKQNGPEEDTSCSLQSYHNSLSYILDGLREAQRSPPMVTVRLKCGNITRRRAILPIVVVMGDQLSQDTLCGRLKSNSGGAGRVHRSCMCSYLNVDDPYHVCKPVNLVTLNFLIAHAMISDDDINSRIIASNSSIMSNNSKGDRVTKNFFQKQRAMFRSILRHPFTTHPINNAFNGIDFGSWSAGIHEATFDDFMHSVESGMIAYIAETVYDGLTKKEKESVEDLTRPFLGDHRCSVVCNYPRWRIQPGFSRQTLMTSGERVGSILALSLSLQDKTIRETIRCAHHRQTQKYLDLSPESSVEKTNMEDSGINGENQTKTSTSTTEFYLDQYMHLLDEKTMKHTLEHMIRHGFEVTLLDELDPFQINQLLWHCTDIFKNTQYPESYPTSDMNGLFADMGHSLVIPKEQLKVVKFALQTKPSKLIDKHRLRRVEGTAGKHLIKKVNKKGEGSSAAVLTSNMGTLAIFLEYVLCYHAFCKYSWSLPEQLQRDYENIKMGNSFVVEYFQKLIYRGNHSVDSRFPKIHAQRRMGENIQQLNTVMNFCCETGERLLKTEAKGISRTAQQRGNNTFLTQTMSRVQERSVLDSCTMYLEDKERQTVIPPSQLKGDCLGRTCPHFVYNAEFDLTLAVNRKNETHDPDQFSGVVSSVVTDALKKHDPNMKIFRLYNEVVLRDSSRLRASPNYHKSGPWYDYVNVSWERVVNGTIETYLLPAKCLCFYPKVCEETGNQEIMALVHTADQHSKGRVAGYTDTLLTRNFRMQFDNKGCPVTHVVPVASIDSAIRCFSHDPNKGLCDGSSPGITYLLPRNHWAYMWIAMNEAIHESNSSGRGKLNSLCNPQWLETVRTKYQRYLKETDIDSSPYSKS